MIVRRTTLTESVARAAAADARRLAAEELVTLLSHDLSNALTPIKGRLDLIRRRAAREGRTQDLDDLNEASRSVQRAQSMVAELLDAARIEQGVFVLSRQTVDLLTLIEEVVALFHPIREAISTRLPDALRIEADPGRLTQVLQNLLGNAVTHTPPGTPIVIGAWTQRRGDGLWAVVSVHDDGPGIAEKMIENIFTKFASNPNSSGLGLGLYLSRQIAEAHGGTLTVESSPGNGTTFLLSLPIDDVDDAQQADGSD